MEKPDFLRPLARMANRFASVAAGGAQKGVFPSREWRRKCAETKKPPSIIAARMTNGAGHESGSSLSVQKTCLVTSITVSI
jgi:hypothetical protein